MENENFTRIPNDILEEAISSKSMCAKARVFMAILRKTYGWNKKEDWIALSQFEKMTGISKSNICRTLRQLVKLKIIIKSDNKYRINPIGKTWKPLSNMITVITSDKPLCQNGQSALSDMTHTKDTITKNTYLQKKDRTLQQIAGIHSNKMTEKDFEEFWKIYPKKGRKNRAKEVFMELKKEILPIILESLKSQKSSHIWKMDSGSFIPYADNWLRD